MLLQGGSAVDPFAFGEFPNPTTPMIGNYNLSGKTLSSPRLNAGETTGVFVVGGQSNAGNSVDTAYTPTNATKVDNLSIYDGGTYAAKDPLLGCQNVRSAFGNVFGRVADKLINGGVYQRVILIPASIGATTINQWVNNASLYQRLIVAGRRASAVGLPITAYLWMQGENDNYSGTSQAAYSADLSTLIGMVRAAGFTTPWLVGQCTYLSGTTSAAVRAAQAAAVNGTDIFAGADTDTVTGTAVNRQPDNTHLTGAGADACATLWKTAIDAVF